MPQGGVAGFKGLRLTAKRPEKRQCSTCCHDFRNRAAWNPYKTSKNTWFFYWFAKNAARNRVRPGRGEPCLLRRFPHFPRLRPALNPYKTIENTVFFLRWTVEAGFHIFHVCARRRDLGLIGGGLVGLPHWGKIQAQVVLVQGRGPRPSLLEKARRLQDEATACA